MKRLLRTISLTTLADDSSCVPFHYYTQDYLGNNRAVVNGSTGAVEQSIAYYPYGGVIANLGTPITGQPYKYDVSMPGTGQYAV